MEGNNIRSPIGLFVGLSKGETVMAGDVLVVVRKIEKNNYVRLAFIGPKSTKIERHLSEYPPEYLAIAKREKRIARGLRPE